MEDVLDGIKAYFDASLEATLVAIETARDVTIPRLGGAISLKVDRSKQYPAMTIYPNNVEYDYGPSDAPREYDPVITYMVTIVMRHVSSDAEAVQDVLLRYAEAIVDMRNADITFGGMANISTVHLGESDFLPIRDAQQEGSLQQSFIQDIYIIRQG